MTSVKETLWDGDEATLTQYVKNQGLEKEYKKLHQQQLLRVRLFYEIVIASANRPKRM